MRDGSKLLIQGRYADAVKSLTHEASRDEDVSGAGVIVYLPLAQYLAGDKVIARSQMKSLLAKYGRKAAVHYVFAGTLAWMDRKFAKAIDLWKVGPSCPYSLTYSKLECPLLLWYAAISRPKTFAASEALQLIEANIRHVPSDVWPSAVGRFVLGLIDEETARQEAVHKEGKFAKFWTRDNLHMLDFYVAIARRRDGDKEGCLALLRQCAVAKGVEHVHHEMLLARAEVEQPSKNN